MSEKAKKSDSKIKTIFDHIKHLRAVGEYEYFDSLSDDDKKSWSNFMAIRILSMHFELLEIVNIFQRYHYLSPELFYKLCVAVIPTGNGYAKYIKPSVKDPISDEDLSALMTYYNENEEVILMYIKSLDDQQIKTLTTFVQSTKIEE